MNKPFISVFNETVEEKVEYGHDCWGATERHTSYELNRKKLAAGLLQESLNLINEQLVGCTLEQREVLHRLKQTFTKFYETSH